jgi:serine/threonine protein kinase
MLNREEFKKLIFNKYKIKKLIHSSGFAYVYQGIDVKNNIPVALKLENRKSKFNILESEAYILMNVKGHGIPKVISYGHHNIYNVLVEELLGKSIGKIFDRMRANNFNLKDICMMAIQSLERLEHIHSKLVIHRDIKPDNLVIGLNDPNIIYLIDFGLSRKYRSSRTGKHIKFNNLKLTYGSLRYLSINGNKGYEQSRRDDLESLGYMLIFLATGTVPWIKAEKFKVDVVKKYIIIYKIKKAISSEKLCTGLPKEMVQYIDYCKNLYFEQDPNYDYLKSLFYNILTNINQKNDMKFSWISKRDMIRIKHEKNIRNESKNRNDLHKRKVSPQVRLLNKIQSNLQNSKNAMSVEVNKKLNIENKITQEKHNLKPLNIILNNNEENTNSNEKHYSVTENENIKNKKIIKNIETEITKLKETKIINTENNSSINTDKKEDNKNNKNTLVFNNNNMENEEKALKSKKLRNIQIIDENNLYEFNYQTIEADDNNQIKDKDIKQDEELDKFYDYYNNIIKANDKETNFSIEKKTMEINDNNRSNIERGNTQKQVETIKFISDDNFWDDDFNELNEGNIFKTYNNADLMQYNINSYNSNLINNYKQLKLNLLKSEPKTINNNINNINNYASNQPKMQNNIFNNISNYPQSKGNNNNKQNINNNYAKISIEGANKRRIIENQKNQKRSKYVDNKNIIKQNNSNNYISPIRQIKIPNNIHNINKINNNYYGPIEYNNYISPFAKNILINKKAKTSLGSKENQNYRILNQNINRRLNNNQKINLTAQSNLNNRLIINNINAAKFETNNYFGNNFI